MMGDERGLTLLELLVAMAVFAVLSLMSYHGLQSMIDSKTHAETEAAQLAGLQSAFTLMARDIIQATPRRVRDEFGDPLPAMIWRETGEPELEFTRSGWRNPAGLARSNLQRVAYRFSDEQLIRRSWFVLDRGTDSSPFSNVLLEKVDAFTVKFLDRNDQWLESWPSETQASNPTQGGGSSLPRAVSVSVELEGWGRINRIFVIAGQGG